MDTVPLLSDQGGDEESSMPYPAPISKPKPQSVVSSLNAKSATGTKSAVEAFLKDLIHFTHWECCNCGEVHENKHFKWLKRVKESCSKYQRCLHDRCSDCYNLDRKGFRRQYCDGRECDQIIAPKRLVPAPRFEPPRR